MIQIKPISAFSDNYIWCLYDDISGQAVVVDPGDAAPVKTALADNHLQLNAILITHHHADHIGGVNDLLSEFDVPVYGPNSPNIPQITHTLTEADTITVLGMEFTALTIPGHTLDHIALFCSASTIGPILFCGDTLFAGGCGRVFEGNPEMMLASLSKLAKLPADTRVYCAHEYTLSNLAFAVTVEPANPQLLQRIAVDTDKRNQGVPTVPSTLQAELQTNPFLRCDTTTVIHSAQHHSGHPCLNPVDVFAAIRHWKDSF